MITISTVGVPNTIKRLASYKLQSTLAIRFTSNYHENACKIYLGIFCVLSYFCCTLNFDLLSYMFIFSCAYLLVVLNALGIVAPSSHVTLKLIS